MAGEQKTYTDILSPHIIDGVEHITFRSRKLLKWVNSVAKVEQSDDIGIKIERYSDEDIDIKILLKGSDDGYGFGGFQRIYEIPIWKIYQDRWVLKNDSFNPRFYQSLFKNIHNVLTYRRINGTPPTMQAQDRLYDDWNSALPKVGSPVVETNPNEPPSFDISDSSQRDEDVDCDCGDTNENKLRGIKDEHDVGIRPGADFLLNKQNYDTYSQQFIDSVFAAYDEDTQLEKKVNKLFRKIFEYGTGDFSERLDVKKLIRHLETYKDPYSCFKRDVRPPKLVVFFDVSGSMAPVVKTLVQLSMTLSKVNHNLLIIINTNGTPQRIINEGVMKELHLSGKNYSVISEWCINLFKKYHVKYVLNFADFDGAKIWEEIFNYSDCKWSWFHYWHAKRHNNRPILCQDKKIYLPEGFHKDIHRLDFWYAVGNSDAAIHVLSKVKP